ncbi:unnamed protein product [Schistosoma turkestanicum]|nr:unnamed protein product [Schistosoma turkestanicum]
MNFSNSNGLLNDVILSQYFIHPNQTIGNDTLFSNHNNHLKNDIKRVTLKIDISHTNHSYIIGRYGWNIKKIMMNTQCHIHFPDSNRNSSIFKKSNQVSITGQLKNVERARRIIRDILPVTFTFEIPYLNNESLISNQNSQTIRQLQNDFDVEITFRNHYTLTYYRKTTVSVKGLTINVKKTKNVVRSLIKQYFVRNTDIIPVNTYINMDAKHSSLLHNKISSDNLIKLVHETTGANVNFSPSTSSITNSTPSPSSLLPTFSTDNQVNCMNYFSSSSNQTQDSNNHYLSQSFQNKLNLIHIYGDVDNVFLARQLIMNLLPVVLIFDVSILQGEWLGSFNFSNLCQYYEVNIIIRNKPKDLLKSVVIRTNEKNIRSLYIMWELIQDLLSQFTRNTIYEIDSPSCLNSSNYQIQIQRPWLEDIYKPEIPSFLDKDKILIKKEGNKENSEEQIRFNYTTSCLTSLSLSAPSSTTITTSSLSYYEPSGRVNLFNNNFLHLINYKSFEQDLWNLCEHFKDILHKHENSTMMDDVQVTQEENVVTNHNTFEDLEAIQLNSNKPSPFFHEKIPHL